MDELAAIRTQRDTRRLNCLIFQADLHATGEEHQQLIAVKHAVRAGHMELTVAIESVTALRAQQTRAA